MFIPATPARLARQPKGCHALAYQLEITTRPSVQATENPTRSATASAIAMGKLTDVAGLGPRVKKRLGKRGNSGAERATKESMAWAN
jgi:hypothetical protein